MNFGHFAFRSGLASLVAAQAYAVSARYFLSLQGLSEANDDQSAANTQPNLFSDPLLSSGGFGSFRLYLWADLSPLGTTTLTDLKRIDLAVATTGNLMILRTNIWQRTIDLDPDNPTSVFRRWASAPGIQNWNSNFADMSPAVATLESGLSTRNSVRIYDNQDRAGDLWLFGWIEISGTVGDVQIFNNATGFLQRGTPTNTVYLGVDDLSGGPAVISGQAISYANQSPEAFVGPEPSALALMTLAAIAIRRR